MANLSVFSGRDVVKALAKLGYKFDRQRSPHMIVRHRDPPHRRSSVPDPKEVAKETLRSIIREAGLTVDEFIALL